MKYSGIHFITENGHGGSYPTIDPGEHSFPFHFQIPQRKLPSSFEGKFGHIRYWLKATMDRPWKSNYNSKSAITILEVVDINEHWALVSAVLSCTSGNSFILIDSLHSSVQCRFNHMANAAGPTL